MALISCRECGKEVSESAPKCPHCGVARPNAEANKQSRNVGLVGCGLALAILFGFVIYVSTDIQQESDRAAAAEAAECADGLRPISDRDGPGTRVLFEDGEFYGRINDIDFRQFPNGYADAVEVVFPNGDRNWFRLDGLARLGYQVAC